MAGLIALLYYLGSYYESETDIFFVVYAKGLLTNKPLALPETFNVQILIGYLSIWLYDHYPQYEWYDYLTFFSTFCIGLLLIKIYEKLAKIIAGNVFFSFAIAFFFIAVFISITLIPELARLPFLITTASYLIISLKLIRAAQISLTLLLTCYALILFSALRRIEPAMALTFLFAGYLVLLAFEKRIHVVYAIKLFLPCVLIVSFVFAYIHIPRTPEGFRYLKVMPYENGIADFKSNPAVLHLTSKEDSIKYYAASHFFFCDTKHLNAEFFQKIGVVPLDKSPSFFMNYISRTSIVKSRWDMLVKDIFENENWLFLLSVFINLLWLFTAFRHSLKEGTGRLVFTCIFWATFLFPNLFMKVETKVNESLLIFLILVLLIHFICFELQSAEKNMIRALAFILITTVVMKGFSFSQLYQTRKNDAFYMDKVRDTISHTISNSLVVFNVSCWDRISIRLFDYDNYNLSNTHISFDNGILYLYDEYNNYMRQVTSQSEFINQVDYVAHRTDAYWLSSEARMKMVVEYINTIYNRNYQFILVNEISRKNSHSYRTPLIGIYKVEEKERNHFSLKMETSVLRKHSEYNALSGSRKFLK